MSEAEDLLKRIYEQVNGPLKTGYHFEEPQDGITALILDPPATLSDGPPKRNDGLDENRELLLELERSHRKTKP